MIFNRRKTFVVTGVVSVFVALFLSGCPQMTLLTADGHYVGHALSLDVGSTVTLQVRSASCDDVFSWFSSAQEVAVVDASGTVTAVAPGTAVIAVIGSVSHASASVALRVSPTTACEGETHWIPGESGPGVWSLAPLQPTASDILSFSGPTAQYGNACMAITTAGVPHIMVNTTTHSVELVFELAPVKRCANVQDPVCGLGGSFGPLPEGDWVFSSHNERDPLISFELSFHVGPPPPGGQTPVRWVAGESAPGAWSLAPLSPTRSDLLHFSGPTALYGNTCVAVDSVGAPRLVVDPVSRTVELAFEPQPIIPCAMIYQPVCGLAGTFGPLACGDWVFFSHSVHDDLISFEIHFHVGPPPPEDHVPVTWIAGETGPSAWTAERLPCGMPSNGIRLSGPTQLFPSACDGNAALGGEPFIAVDRTAHTLTLAFQGPPQVACPDIYAPVSGLQADIIGLASGTWTFNAPMLTPPVQLTFIVP